MKIISSIDPRKALYLGAAFLIVALLGSTIGLVLHLREAALKEAERQQQVLSRTLAQEADRSLQSISLVLSSIADFMSANGIKDEMVFNDQMSSYTIHELLQSKLSGYRQIDAITLINREGQLVNFSRSWPIPQLNVSDGPYFQALKADPTLVNTISPPLKNRVTGAWTIYLAHRLTDSHGEFMGLILGAVALRYFEDFYRAAIPDPDSAISLMKQDGTLLVRYPRTNAVGTIFTQGNVHRITRTRLSATIRGISPVDGRKRIVSSHTLEHFPLVILAAQTEEAALASWRKLGLLVALVVFCLCAAVAITARTLDKQWRQREKLVRTREALRLQKDRTAAYEALAYAKDAAEAANRAKSDFIATMSHELRTPLNIVIGFSEMIMKELKGPLGNPHYRSYVEDIHQSGTHLLGIINGILDLSSAEAGKLQLTLKQINVPAFVADITDLMTPRANTAGLMFTTTVPGECSLVADQDKLRQMLLNLLSNAFKFTEPGGHVNLNVTEDTAGVAFTIADSGIGISAKDLDRVFEPFAQADSSLSRKREGAGLGLPVTKKLAELHGGWLRVESEEGTGTRAILFLPHIASPPQR